MKASAQNALVGGILLAGIEGMGLVIQRVLVPQIEAYSQPGGAKQHVDTLEPPIDYRRPYYRKTRFSVDAEDVTSSSSTIASS
jgi:hypothetical protein